MRDLQSRQNSKLLAAVYIFCFVIAAVGDSKFLPSSAKVATLLTVGMALFILMVTADFKNLKTIGGFAAIYGIWFFVIMVYSMILWILDFQTVSFIVRGCSKISYQFIIVAVIAAAAYMFGEKGIHYTFYGLALGNAAIAVLYVPKYGIGGVISSFMTFVAKAGDAVGYMRSLEIHDITFTFGFFLIYFIFFDKISSKKSKIFNIIVAAFFFYVGFKRIAIGSFFLIMLVAFILKKLTPRNQIIVMKTTLICAAIFAFCYLFALKYNIFMMLMNEFGVDVMGRNVLYDYIDKYYRISPTFLGYGFEYIHIMMLEIAKSGGREFNGMIDIHNDFMRVYIEMGFFGFISWLYYTLIFQFNWIKSKFNVDTMRLFFLCELYIYFTYMTDNTLFYFYTGMVLRLIPMCYALHQDFSENEKEHKRKLVVIDDKVQRRFEILSQTGQKSITLYKKKTTSRPR